MVELLVSSKADELARKLSLIFCFFFFWVVISSSSSRLPERNLKTINMVVNCDARWRVGEAHYRHLVNGNRSLNSKPTTGVLIIFGMSYREHKY